jgi:Sulfotransferase family
MISPKHTLGDDQLIFLISQPRSGSTLLQHILGSHPQVHTLPEPWFMLHLVYALRERGISTEYNASYALVALKGFLRETQKSEDDYLKLIRDMALKLYAGALDGSGKRFFLDKTPRYYFILPELYRLFHNAHFILLVRNPLAVLTSILHVNLDGRVQDFLSEDRQHDILTAPQVIVAALKQSDGRTTVVRYEELVSNPESTMLNVCAKLDLTYEPNILKYGDKVRLNSSFVDPKSIYKHDRPVTDYVESWPQYLDTGEKLRMARAYLQLLGKETVEGLGYSYGEIKATLERLKPKSSWIRLPWARLLDPSAPLPWWHRGRLAVLAAMGHRPAKKALRYTRNRRHRRLSLPRVT